MNLENLPSAVIQQILSKKIEEIMKYDKSLGGFTFSQEQLYWDGKNLTKEFLESIVVAEMLNPYQAIQWINYNDQQADFNTLNDYILETSYEGKEDVALKYIENDKEKWAILWKTKMEAQKIELN